jgi:hypothetical protein
VILSIQKIGLNHYSNRIKNHLYKPNIMKNEKKEAIEKAYGEYWDKVKDYIDENGFVESEHFPHGKIDADFGVYYGELASDFYIRPKSLKGIEDNIKQ